MPKRAIRRKSILSRTFGSIDLVQLALQAANKDRELPLCFVINRSLDLSAGESLNDLTISANTKNLCLKTTTQSKTINGGYRVLLVGLAVVPPDTTGPRIPDGIEEGFSTTNYSGTAPDADNYYYLWDRWGSVEREGDGNNTRPTGGELVFVTDVDTVNHTVTFRDPVSRPYPAFDDNVTDTLLSTVPK